MKFRIATPADIPAINQLVNGAYRGDSARRGWTTEADLLDGIRTSEASLQEMIEKPGAIILLAEESKLLGCVYLEKQDDTLYLGMLTVDPALQGNGIGAAMLEAAEQRALEHQCAQIKMTVITSRHELIAYYRRKGFVETGERQPFPSDPKFGIPKQPLEFLVMVKALPL